MCGRFMEIWRRPRRRSTVQQKARRRDEGLCQVPFCSRAATPVHHIVFRSHGGGNGLENLTSLCAAHHHAVHAGWIRVWGEAPDKLQWQLGVRPGLPPLYEFVSVADGPPMLVRASA
jgi:hypothetical protein